MTATKKDAPRSIGTPLVLAVASAMISIGLVAAFGPALLGSDDARGDASASPIVVDATTPEGAAESYLDAYRRREHAIALALSVGDAHALAATRQARDARATPEELAAKAHLWDKMAAPRLRFVVTSREPSGATGERMRGRAEGTFLEQRYVREVSFEVVPEDGEWRVARMELGEVLEGPSVATEDARP